MSAYITQHPGSHYQLHGVLGRDHLCPSVPSIPVWVHRHMAVCPVVVVVGKRVVLDTDLANSRGAPRRRSSLARNRAVVVRTSDALCCQLVYRVMVCDSRGDGSAGADEGIMEAFCLYGWADGRHEQWLGMFVPFCLGASVGNMGVRHRAVAVEPWILLGGICRCRDRGRCSGDSRDSHPGPCW